MKNLFDTKEEAEAYKKKHKLFQRKAEYINCRGKWSLIFDIKPCLEVKHHNEKEI